jgi:hypothetical protein
MLDQLGVLPGLREPCSPGTHTPQQRNMAGRKWSASANLMEFVHFRRGAAIIEIIPHFG